MRPPPPYGAGVQPYCAGAAALAPSRAAIRRAIGELLQRKEILEAYACDHCHYVPFAQLGLAPQTIRSLRRVDPQVRSRFLSAVGPGLPFRQWHGSFFTINMNERSSNVVSLFVVMVPDEHANNSAYVNGTMSIALNFAFKASAERSSVVQLLAKAAVSWRALNGPSTTSPISCKHSPK